MVLRGLEDVHPALADDFYHRRHWRRRKWSGLDVSSTSTLESDPAAWSLVILSIMPTIFAPRDPFPIPLLQPSVLMEGCHAKYVPSPDVYSVSL